MVTVFRQWSGKKGKNIMNQKVAKRIRKQIYGPKGPLREREYIVDEKTKQVVNLGFRRMYQDAKKVYKDRSR